MSGSKSRYIPALDGLRAFAVLAVIAYHMNFSWAQGGLLGVTVFFVDHAVECLYLPDDLFEPAMQIVCIHALSHETSSSHPRGSGRRMRDCVFGNRFAVLSIYESLLRSAFGTERKS